MSDDCIRRADADRLIAENEARLAEIWNDLRSRIEARLAAGDDPRTAASEEVHRAVAQLDAVQAAFEKALQALPSYPEAPPQ